MTSALSRMREPKKSKRVISDPLWLLVQGLGAVVLKLCCTLASPGKL